MEKKKLRDNAYFRLHSIQLSSGIAIVPKTLPLLQTYLSNAAFHSTVREQRCRVNDIRWLFVQRRCFGQDIGSLIAVDTAVGGHPMHANRTTGHHNPLHTGE